MGVWSESSQTSRTYKIDTKRMYTISASTSADIQIPELASGETVCLFHHRSDGQVYVSVRGSGLVAKMGDTILGSEPVVLSDEISIGDGDTRIELLRQSNAVSVREALRACQTEDEATRRNTALNGAGGKRRGTPIRGGGTPLSGYRPRKRTCDVKDIENRSVRFLDFTAI